MTATKAVRTPALRPRIAALCAVVLAQNLLHRELSAPFIVLLGFWLMASSRLPASYKRLVWPLGALFVTGLLGFAGHEFRHVLRDIFFALTPISLIFLGYWIAQNPRIWHFLPRTLMLLGLFFALIHLSAFVADPSLLTADSMVVRAIAGNVADIEILGFLFGLYQARFTTRATHMAAGPRALVLAILAVSIFLSYSRTALVFIVIVCFALQGWLSRINLKFVGVVSAIVGFFAISYALTPQDDFTSFGGKMVRSLTELAVSDYDSITDISINWRGFETFKALETFLSGAPYQLVIGQGFGSLIDLGFSMPLGGAGDVEFQYIPITHNGYAYLLVKTGLAGLLMYFIFYATVIRQAVRYGRLKDPALAFPARLMLGCILCLILVMFVAGGAAEMTSAEMVLLVGYLMQRLHRAGIQAGPGAPAPARTAPRRPSSATAPLEGPKPC